MVFDEILDRAVKEIIELITKKDLVILEFKD